MPLRGRGTSSKMKEQKGWLFLKVSGPVRHQHLHPGQSWDRLQSLRGDGDTSGITASLGFSFLRKARQLLEEGHLMCCYLPPQHKHCTEDCPRLPVSCSAPSPCSEARDHYSVGQCLLKHRPDRSAMPFARWSAEGAQWKPSANPPNDIFSQGWGQELGKGTAGHRERRSFPGASGDSSYLAVMV